MPQKKIRGTKEDNRRDLARFGQGNFVLDYISADWGTIFCIKHEHDKLYKTYIQNFSLLETYAFKKTSWIELKLKGKTWINRVTIKLNKDNAVVVEIKPYFE